MGGVNLSEESKNILASNADFIGTQIRSCKDEAFLFHGALLSKITAIGMLHERYWHSDLPYSLYITTFSKDVGHLSVCPVATYLVVTLYSSYCRRLQY